MTDETRYLVVGGEKFHQDVRALRRQAEAVGGRHLHLYRELLREIERLRNGTTDGHHALGYEAGKGDLRDCVTAYLRSDPGRNADYRLVFREIGPAEPGQLPRRELLAIKPRHGRNNIYAHVCARLSRHPNDRQPGLNRFGDRRPDARGSEAARRAELDAKRAIAHAWAGQQPLGSARPVASPLIPRGSPSGQRIATGVRYDAPRRPAQSAGADTPYATGYPRHGRTQRGPTGWPPRER
ncbi:hypothetical protein [Kribbella rubisoli]|uniref:hypothetical protein n=1 Tax=Kribbella rubisoli TaxID=3075929 RepID=UPI00102C12EA|nr:hypothetical protein [Kribbella rubisoli]